MLPGFIIIGAQKCGTTSLHHYLSQHPEISMSKRKETNFFIEEGLWSKGLKWYESQFEEGAKICGESSPNYTFYPEFRGVPERMHGIVPDAKLIYLVRNPVERIISHYYDLLLQKREHRTIEEVVNDPSFGDSEYVARSRYHFQLEQYLKHFKRNQILVILAEDLKQNRRETLRQIFDFLDVDKEFESPEFDREKNRSDWKFPHSRRRSFLRKIYHYDQKSHRHQGLLSKFFPSQWLQSAVRKKSATQRPIKPKASKTIQNKILDCLDEDLALFKSLAGINRRIIG